MPSSTDAALLEKIESLSFLRQLNDRLAEADDFPAACAALVDLLWQERGLEVATYFSVEPGTTRLRLEAAAPPLGSGRQVVHRGDTAPFAALMAAVEPIVLTEPLPVPVEEAASPDAVWLGVSLRVRGVPTGVLCVRTSATPTRLEEDGRVLAIAATSAALALDVSRSGQREEFVAMLRHDIANPLMTALGYADILAEQIEADATAPTMAALGTIKEQLRAISELVTNYLHMTAIDRGAPTLRWEAVDLRELVADLDAVLGMVARDKGISLRTAVSCTGVRADRRQLQRVLTNLLSNAIKYTPAHGAVALSAVRDGDDVVIAVQDDGFGIAPEDHPRVFTKYARFHCGRGIPGTGLGLYLSKGIVEAHGGTITVDSAPGRGSTFQVRLPADGIV